MAIDAVIVGAGMAGLSCAVWLGEAGLRVHVLEADTLPGGRARSWLDPATGDSVDIGPHVLLSQYANMRKLLTRLDTAAEVHWQTEELLTVLDRGRRIHVRLGGLPAPLHPARNLFRLLPSTGLAGLLSNLPLAWRTLRSTDAERMALDKHNARDYLLAHGVSPNFADWFWASASMALLNVPLEQCSATALLRLFAQALGQPGMAFGLPRIGLSDLYAWPAVNLIERQGGQVRFAAPVAGLLRREEAVAGVTLADGSVLEADTVVLAVPPTALGALLPAGHPLLARARYFEPSPYVSCYLWFDRRLTRTRFWALPWSPERLNTDFYDLSNIRDGFAERGSLVASNIIWSHRAAALDDAAIIQATLDELAEFAPAVREARLLHAVVHRIPMAVPCPYPGTEAQRPESWQEPGLFLAGDWLATGLPCCMESAARAGALAAEAVLTERGRPQGFACPPPQPQGLTRWLQRTN